MYKRLRIYYFYVALPFVLLLLGAAVYFDAIKKTIVSNPHPQINYAIFVIIVLDFCATARRDPFCVTVWKQL